MRVRADTSTVALQCERSWLKVWGLSIAVLLALNAYNHINTQGWPAHV
eukprot:COSAG05_NODE_18493_length_307_cov_1.250000_1_plen_47_part_01